MATQWENGELPPQSPVRVWYYPKSIFSFSLFFLTKEKNNQDKKYTFYTVCIFLFFYYLIIHPPPSIDSFTGKKKITITD
jgi:hypothetical protein